MLIVRLRYVVPGLTAALVAGAALAQDGFDIPASYSNAAISTQTNPTSYGNDTLPGQEPENSNGSEQDQLWIDDDATNLHLSVTGNLEYNGNAFLIFLDTIPGAGQNVLLSDPGVDEGPPYAFNGLHNSTMEAGFAPDFCIAVDCFGGSIYVTKYTLEAGVVASVANGKKEYLGQNFVASGFGDLDISTTFKVAFDNGNIDGVLGTGDGMLGDPTTALNGMETLLPKAEIGLGGGKPGPVTDIKVWTLLKSGSGDGYISNQALPPFDGLGDEINPIGNNACFDVCADANCDGAVDSEDIDPFFIALGDAVAWQAMFPCNLCVCDVNHDGAVDAEDIDPFFVALGAATCNVDPPDTRPGYDFAGGSLFGGQQFATYTLMNP